TIASWPDERSHSSARYGFSPFALATPGFCSKREQLAMRDVLDLFGVVDRRTGEVCRRDGSLPHTSRSMARPVASGNPWFESVACGSGPTGLSVACWLLPGSGAGVKVDLKCGDGSCHGTSSVVITSSGTRKQVGSEARSRRK